MKTVSLEVFYGMLERHDWFWVFADAQDNYNEGNRAESKLQDIAAEGGPEYVKLLHEYHEHVWSGEAWKTPKAPKPVKPGQN